MRRLLLLVLLTAAACKSDPVSGRLYYSPLGSDFESQDKYVREHFVTELMIAQDGGVLPEPQINAVCRKIVGQVLKGVPKDHRREFRYSFILQASSQVNAYTYGAGRLHCHLGLIARCQDASEFAGVMAHEVGHISHDHFGQRLGRSSLAESILSPFRIPGPRLLHRFGSSVAGFVLVQHTRSQEQESDDRAVDYAVAAGFDPDGLARFFEGMERDFPGEAGGPQLFQTHPYPANRVKKIRKRIEQDHGGVAPEAVRTFPEFELAAARARRILPFYETLEEALTKDDAEKVIAAADAGIASLPHHPAFHFWRGLAFETKEEHEPALASLRQAARLDKTNLLIPYVLGVVEITAENYAEAEAAASATLALVPVLAAPYMMRGVARYKMGRKEEANEDFDLLIGSSRGRQREEILEKIRTHAPEYTFDEARFQAWSERQRQAQRQQAAEKPPA
ncbi:MAG: M48 family metalloprotease [Planctomycetota bacterium]